MRPTSFVRNVKAVVEANAASSTYTSGITTINLPAVGRAAHVSLPQATLKLGDSSINQKYVKIFYVEK